MKILFQCAVWLCVVFPAFSQSGGKINGQVFDSITRLPVEYTTITISERTTGKVISGAIADANGTFAIDAIPNGSYVVSLEFIGYEKRTVDNVSVTLAAQKVSVGKIYLSPTSKAIEGVTVTADAPVVENKIDKIVYNAANDVTAQGGLALDILKKVPLVTVDIDGNVELQGNSNIKFLINGKPSSIFGSNLAEALATIPASQIKSIEAITSPGAKSDVQGTGGIINIILKDSRSQGINGSINLSGGTRLENGSGNLNIRKNNFGVNLFFSGNAQLVSRTPMTQDRSSYDTAGNISSQLYQRGYADFQRNGLQAGAGFDWSPTKKDNVNGSFSFNHFGNQSDGFTLIQQDTAGSSTSPIISTRNSLSRFENNSYDWSLNYKRKFKKGSLVHIGVSKRSDLHFHQKTNIFF